MTRLQQRKKVIEREKLIRKLRGEGKTWAEVAAEFGVSTGRVRNIYQQSKHRPPIVDRLAAFREAAREDRELAKRHRILFNPGHSKPAAEILGELRESLLTANFSSTSVTGNAVRSIVVVVGKPLRRPRHPDQISGMQAVVNKVRRCVLDSAETILVRRHDPASSKAFQRRVWSFTFAKS